VGDKTFQSNLPKGHNRLNIYWESNSQKALFAQTEKWKLLFAARKIRGLETKRRQHLLRRFREGFDGLCEVNTSKKRPRKKRAKMPGASMKTSALKD